MKKHTYLDPARSVLRKLGSGRTEQEQVLHGIEIAAAVTGRHASRVRRWMYPREYDGGGGVIPHECAAKLLEFARQHEKPLKPADFFCPSRHRIA